MQRRLIWTAIALVLLALFWGARQIYLHQIDEAQYRAEEQLQTIAQLKVDQIATWRKERLGDGEVIRNNPLLTNRLIRWLKGAPDAETPRLVQAHVEELERQYGYQDYWLVDADGQIRLHNGTAATGLLESDLQAALKEALASRRAVLSKIHIGSQYPFPHMALVVPLFEGEQPAGAMLLAIDPLQDLYRFVQSWPVPSATAETVIIHREGDDVVFLNQLRHTPNPPLSLRIPINQTQLPAVQAALGKTGLIEGLDYRGIPVVAVGLPIPASPWFLLAKVDRHEIYADAQRVALFLGGWLLSVLVLLGMLPGFLWQRRKRQLEDKLNRAESAQLKSLKDFQSLFERSQDGILILSGDHRLLEANPAALQSLGYHLGEFRKMRLPEILATEERSRLGESIKTSDGLMQHEEWVYQRKDGSSFIGDTTASALGPSRYVMTFHDITERKAIESIKQAQAELQQQLTQFAQTVPGVIYIYRLRPDGTSYCPYMGPRVEELYGVTAAKAAEDAQFMIDRIAPEDRDEFLQSIQVSAQALKPWNAEFRIHHPQRGEVWIEAVSMPTAESDGCIVWHGFLFDITRRKQVERQLRLSQFVMESSADVILWIRPDSSIFYANESACRLLGVTMDQITRLSVLDIDAVMTPEGWHAHWQELKEKKHISLESVVRHSIAGETPVEVSANYLQFEGNEYNCAILRDITERRATEKERRLTQLAVQQASDSIYWFREDGSIYYVNETACRSLGYTREELLSMTVFDMDPAYSRAMWARDWDRSSGSQSVTLETINQRRDGSRFAVEVTGNFLRLEGKRLKCAIVRDISERKAAQAELQQRMKLLESIQDIVRLGSYSTDLRTRRWTGSPMLDDIMGIDASYDHSVLNWARLIHPQDHQRAINEFEHAIQSRERLHHQYRIIRRRDGEIAWVDAWGVFEYEDDQPVRMFGAVMDITDQKAAEEALRVARDEAQIANKAKSQFLAHMSHEIRTPMNGVLGMAQLMERESLSDDQHEMVEHILSSGKSLLSIINDILDLSKIEAGQLRLEIIPFDLAQTLARIEQISRVGAEAKGIGLRMDLAAELAGDWRGDALRLEQILFNLVGNAIKFTDQGEVVVIVQPRERSAAEGRVRFEVRDTGIGLSQESVAQLFTPFNQADSSISRRFGGTGLGLVISKYLVELMGGEIGVKSTPGKGSTFWFELPLERTDAEIEGPALPTPQADSEIKARRLQGLRLMVVDDSKINRSLAERALKREGAEVTLKNDGQEAVDCLRARPTDFDLVLMDIQMPVMDGLTATRAIRHELKLENLPVIALTAGVLPEERQNALDAGINDFLPKPMVLDQMAEMISRYCGASAATPDDND